MINIEAILKFIKEDFIYFVEDKIVPKVYLVEGDALKITADFILRKSTKTLKAVCELCLKGYGEDAQVLGRTILENFLTLAFICKSNSKETMD